MYLLVLIGRYTGPAIFAYFNHCLYHEQTQPDVSTSLYVINSSARKNPSYQGLFKLMLFCIYRESPQRPRDFHPIGILADWLNWFQCVPVTCEGSQTARESLAIPCSYWQGLWGLLGLSGRLSFYWLAFEAQRQ